MDLFVMLFIFSKSSFAHPKKGELLVTDTSKGICYLIYFNNIAKYSKDIRYGFHPKFGDERVVFSLDFITVPLF